MSRNFAVLGKSSERLSPPSTTDSPGDYTQLIQRLFHDSSVVAVIGAGYGDGVTGICESIASELSRQGRRVVLVSVRRLLPMNPITLPDETAFLPGPAQNVWLWPSPLG